MPGGGEWMDSIGPKTVNSQTQLIEERKGNRKQWKTKKGRGSPGQQRSICPAVKTRLSHKIEHAVNKIVTEILREVLNSCCHVRFCSKKVHKNTYGRPRHHWPVLTNNRHMQYTTKWMHWVTPNLIRHTQNCNGLAIGRLSLKYTASYGTDTTDYTLQKPMMCFGSRAPHRRAVLQNGQDKTLKESHKERLIMKYSPEIPLDTVPLGSCSGNRMKMPLHEEAFVSFSNKIQPTYP